MNKKIKAFLSMLFMSITFYMMLETKYVNALGDYLIEFIGLKSWTGDYTGVHLTIFYFMPLFIIGTILVKKYIVNDLKINWKIVVIIFIGLNTIFALSTGAIAKQIKGSSPGLLSIGLEDDEINNMEYKFNNSRYIDFEAEIKLVNYSKEDKEFHLMIVNDYNKNHDIKLIRLYNLDGSKAVFKLEGKEEKIFSISLDEYIIKGGYINEKSYDAGAGSGVIVEVIILDDKGEEVKLDENNFFGVRL